MEATQHNEVERNLKRTMLNMTRLEERINLMYDRIGHVSGASGPSTILAAGAATGTIVAGTGLYGGGSLPGTVTLHVDEAYAFTWTAVHTHEANIVLDDGSGN